MNKKMKHFAKLCLFLISLFLILLGLSDKIRIQKNQQMSGLYYKFQENTFDVLFFGTSILYRGVYPMNLWNQYGIVSFNLGSGNESIPMSYYLIKDGIEKDSPSLIVLECSFINREGKVPSSPYIHYVTDNMPYFNLNRQEMIFDLIDKKDRDEYIVPFIAYHSNMDKLFSKSAIMENARYGFGARITKNIYDGPLFQMNPVIKENALSETATDYLLKITDLCESKNIPLLLFTIPILSSSDLCSQSDYDSRRNAAYALEDFAKEHDITYLNLVDKFEELNLTVSDSADGFHLNVSGAEKLTAYLGDYIVTHYDIPSRKEDVNYSFMQKAYEEYLAYYNKY